MLIGRLRCDWLLILDLVDPRVERRIILTVTLVFVTGQQLGHLASIQRRPLSTTRRFLLLIKADGSTRTTILLMRFLGYDCSQDAVSFARVFIVVICFVVDWGRLD